MTIPDNIDLSQRAGPFKADRREFRWLRKTLFDKWILVDAQDPPLGAHLGTPRLGYLHHGIYVGGGIVVHYGGYVCGLLRKLVEEVELAQFRDGRSLLLATNERLTFDHAEVIRRARSRIGERRYRLLTNNCEHFCEWCLNGGHRSYQVEALVSWGRRALAAPTNVAIQLLPRPLRNLSGRVLASLSEMVASLLKSAYWTASRHARLASPAAGK